MTCLFWKKQIIFISSLFWCLVHISQAWLKLFFELWIMWNKSLATPMSQVLLICPCYIYWKMREVKSRCVKIVSKGCLSFILCGCLLDMHFGPFNTPLSQLQMEQFVYSAISYGCLLLNLWFLSSMKHGLLIKKFQKHENLKVICN